MKVLLILVDGMRGDSFSDNKHAQKILDKSLYKLDAQTVMPSVTLPCHMSLFHSVDPSRHGTTTNIYAPQVRPINGLCEVLNANKKKIAFFYDWEELRDLSKPGMLTQSCFYKGDDFGYIEADNMLTSELLECLHNNEIDFSFLYLGAPDSAGHKVGWMSDVYNDAVENSWKNIDRVVNSLPDDYTVIITADHGGHDRVHGTDLAEDMTIPVIILGNNIEHGKILNDVNIKDISPTITKLLDVDAGVEWEGKSIL